MLNQCANTLVNTCLRTNGRFHLSPICLNPVRGSISARKTLRVDPLQIAREPVLLKLLQQRSTHSYHINLKTMPQYIKAGLLSGINKLSEPIFN